MVFIYSFIYLLVITSCGERRIVFKAGVLQLDAGRDMPRQPWKKSLSGGGGGGGIFQHFYFLKHKRCVNFCFPDQGVSVAYRGILVPDRTLWQVCEQKR